MNTAQSLSIYVCVELAATALALLLALVCRLAETGARRGPDAAATTSSMDARIDRGAPGGSSLARLRRP